MQPVLNQGFRSRDLRVHKTPGSPASGGAGSPSGSLAGADFKRALDQASQGIGGGLGGPSQIGGPTQVGNASVIPANGISTGSIEKLKFSNHAIERMRSRGIAFAPETMKDIEGAVSKAAAKGAKDTLVLAGDKRANRECKEQYGCYGHGPGGHER